MYWILQQTLFTEPMQLIGNTDVVLSFRIEVFKHSDIVDFRVKVWKLCHFDLRVSGDISETSTEEISVCEESFGFDEIRGNDSDSVVQEVFAGLLGTFEFIESQQ